MNPRTQLIDQFLRALEDFGVSLFREGMPLDRHDSVIISLLPFGKVVFSERPIRLFCLQERQGLSGGDSEGPAAACASGKDGLHPFTPSIGIRGRHYEAGEGAKRPRVGFWLSGGAAPRPGGRSRRSAAPP